MFTLTVLKQQCKVFSFQFYFDSGISGAVRVKDVRGVRNVNCYSSNMPTQNSVVYHPISSLPTLKRMTNHPKSSLLTLKSVANHPKSSLPTLKECG